MRLLTAFSRRLDVWMGTEGPSENLKHGATVEIEITGIGTLRNPVIAEEP